MLKSGIYDFVICRGGTDMCFVLGFGRQRPDLKQYRISGLTPELQHESGDPSCDTAPQVEKIHGRASQRTKAPPAARRTKSGSRLAPSDSTTEQLAPAQ